MKKSSEFIPEWYHEKAPEGSWRSILKWGDPNEFKAPNRRLYAMMKEVFHLSDDDFQEKQDMGLEQVDIEIPCKLNASQVSTFTSMLGSDNVKVDTYTRLSIAYGKTMIDLMRLRKHIAENLPDAVLYPRHTDDVRAIIKFCDFERIPVYVYGGGSSVTRGLEPVCGGVTLDMRRHMNKVLAFSETNQTITVEAGMMGPILEKHLNQAIEEFGAHRRYTCGHFPQSFEYSAVGGWVVTRGAGQNSTYFGNIRDMVIAQTYVTPVGDIVTGEYPHQATGPDMDEIMMGSEGAFGVLCSCTLKFFRLMPENQRRFSYMFRDWQSARDASREIMQAQIGYPSVFRLSDPEETDVAMRLYSIAGTPLDAAMGVLGYKPMERCLMLGFTDGERGFTRNLRRKMGRICIRHGAMPLTGYPVVKWEHGRFRDPYMREDLSDFGLMTDTLECTVTWEQMASVHEQVRAYCHSRPDTICMTHMSHFYPQGANLYFIFIAKINEIDDYLAYQYGILDAIQKSGAAVSHHHGVGKVTAMWLERQVGSETMAVYRALKKHFDPNNIMNPGGTLALDGTLEDFTT